MSWEAPGAVIEFLTTLVRCWCLSGDKHSSTPEAGVERRSSFYSYLEKRKSNTFLCHKQDIPGNTVVECTSPSLHTEFEEFLYTEGCKTLNQASQRGGQCLKPDSV